MTYIYIINVVAPIHNIPSRRVGYNKYPIVCISQKTLEEVLTNEQVRTSLESTLELVGDHVFDKATVSIRVVDGDAHITDYEKPINEILSLWR